MCVCERVRVSARVWFESPFIYHESSDSSDVFGGSSSNEVRVSVNLRIPLTF